MDGDLTYNPSSNTLSVGTLSATTLNSSSATTSQSIGSNLTTGSLTIASAQTTGSITVGSSTSSITMNGNTVISKLAEPLTPIYTYPIMAGKIGEIITYTGATSTPVNAGVPWGLAFVTLTEGVWLLQGYGSGYQLGNYSYIGFNNANNTLGPYGINYRDCLNAAATFFYRVSPVLPATTENWYLITQVGASGITISNIRMSAVRIA